MTETPLLVGPESELLGILTTPDRCKYQGLAFLLFNAGVISRVGPHRVNVKLARALAHEGAISFRFDLSGHGDSRSATDVGHPRTRATTDICNAMNHIESAFGITRFALIGICSGAVNAFAASLTDLRVVGVLMVDGHWYRSRWTLPVRNWKRFRAASYVDVVSAVRRRLALALKAESMHRSEGAIDRTGNPPRSEFIRSLHALVDRPASIVFVYTGSVIDYFSYANQFRDAFAGESFVSKVRCLYCPEIDHTLIALEMQHRLSKIVIDWMGDVARVAADSQCIPGA